MLSEDFGNHLDLNLYKGERNDETLVQIPVTPTPAVTPPVVDVAPVVVQQKLQSAPTPVIHRESPKELKQLSIFDLFENANEPVMEIALSKRTTTTKRQSTKKSNRSIGRQTDLFGGMQQPYTPPKSNGTTNGKPQINGKKQEAIGDLFSSLGGNRQADQPAVPLTAPVPIPEPAFYSQELHSFHRNDSLVVDNGWVGHLQEVDKENATAMFHPLQLPPAQQARAEAYIAVRDTYNDLYQKEAEQQTEHKEERENLNRLYDAFVKKYSNLNSNDNIKLIKTDSAGKEIPYLERVKGGIIHKADIFSHPVSFYHPLATDNHRKH